MGRRVSKASPRRILTAPNPLPGPLDVVDLLQECLIEITGMDAITLQPAAGAHGEFTGILLMRA